jgi:dolichol-phosphate mannosyltransferase
MSSDEAIGNFGIYYHQVISEFNKMGEASRSFSTLVMYLGFRATSVDVEHSARMEGTSSYSLKGLFKLAFDVTLSNTNKPLRIVVSLGFLMSIVSFLLAIYNIVAKWVGVIQFPGYTTTVFSIWFVGGLLLFVIGVLGLYIGKIFDQVKGRQLFIVRDKINL